MSLKHTILGFLNHQNLSGYDLQKKIDNTINHFWPSTQSQIYRTLKELIDNGHVEMQIIYQDEKPNKKEYSITGKGKNELNQWLCSGLDIPNHRNQFLVQLFFSHDLENKTIIKNLKYYRSIMQNRLSFLTSEQVDTRIKTAQNEKKQKILGLITQNGIWALENEIRWVDYAINETSMIK
ncbi:MAG: PadR family transcriptional regulator [Bacteroidales bacterium]|nr:PadR family transcriptional regulator [Bacteroidales bacterium]